MNTARRHTKLSKDEERLVNALHLLGDQTRFKIFKLIMDGGELCVSDIAARLNISASAVSQHFRSFELVGLVERQRKGLRICYALKQRDAFAHKLASLVMQSNKSNN